MGPTQKLFWKLYVGVIGAVTTIAAQRLLKAAWKLVTGNEPPSPTDPDTPVLEAMTWAPASGVGIGVTQIPTQRMAARHWEKEIGTDARTRKTNRRGSRHSALSPLGVRFDVQVRIARRGEGYRVACRSRRTRKTRLESMPG
jgi:hypothetical protein